MNKKIIFSVLITIVVIIISSILYILNLPKETNNIANIVFTTDMEYKEYLKVAIKSAISNKDKDSIYNIIILSVDLPEKENQKFNEFAEKNVKINIVPLKLKQISQVGNFDVSNYVSRADLFKFFMPDILNQYDKILYIDSDTLILKDLLTLYNTDISRYYLAASYKYVPSSYWKKFLWIYYKQPEYDYNCGVMLMNLKKMRKNDIKNKLIESKNNDKIRELMTQTAFNKVIPTKKIKKISPVYNYYARISDAHISFSEVKATYKPFLDNMTSIKDLRNQAVIVHFAGKKKPWFFTDVDYGKEWWQYAKMINKNWKPEPIPEKFLKLGIFL